MMIWHNNKSTNPDTRNEVSPAEVVAFFQQQRVLLGRLALLITADQMTAEQSVFNACELTLHRHTPFRDWLLEWAKAATITSAIALRSVAIRGCEAAYETQHCTHVEHISNDDAEEHEARFNLVTQAPASKVLAELDPLCRAILVLRVATRSSIQDCVLRLNVCRAAVLAANCRAMRWLEEFRMAAPDGQYKSSSTTIEEHWQSHEAH